MNRSQITRWIAKPIVFAAALTPFALAVFGLVSGELGPNPAESLLDSFGEWGLRILLLTLAITPLRKITGIGEFIRFRRMLGLFAAFYVVLHFLVYAVLDQGLNLAYIIEDIIERPYITVGFAGLLILLALTATSPLAARRAMGRRWQQLHYGIYPAAILAVWHFWWQVKKDITEPLIYAAIVGALLGYRVLSKRQAQRSRAPRRPQPIATQTPDAPAA
ncbi:MAG: protein-methionine-sulfoxide reductase heme-binding subunit MsrQ [Pseudomonadota bacterium]